MQTKKRNLLISFHLTFLIFICVSTGAAGPENLAPKAEISANSEYSKNYLARFVADGKIPTAQNHQDLNRAWCVRGETHRRGAEITFTWKQPVAVAQIIYYSRTAWFMEEGWKDYKIFFNDDTKPTVQGRLEMRHGPQRITVPKPAQVRQLKMQFTSSYGGPNPGASEIQIFSRTPSQKELLQFIKATNPDYVDVPSLDKEIEPEDLRRLIQDMRDIHGLRYQQYQNHLNQLKQIEQAKAADKDISKKLADLQRRILLFDLDKLVVIRRHEIIASHVYTYHYEGFKAGGGLYITYPHEPEREPIQLVESPTGQILECDLSYDGQTILFSWRQTQEEGYHIWTINADGTNLKQLTEGPWHDYNACWLPDGGIAFLSSRKAQFAYCWHAPVGVLHRMEPDGSNVRLLSANYLNDFTPYPLDDGRIIYTRWEYVDKPAIPIQSLWTVNPDGTGLSVFFGNRVLSPGTFMEARSIPGTTKIICTMTGHNGPTRGAIGIINRDFGVNAQAAIQNITPEVPIPAVDQGNGNTGGSKQYSCPLPLDAKRFLVSARGPILLRTYSGDYQSVVLAKPDNGMQYFCAQPIRSRPRPPIIPTTLADSQQKDQYATVYLQDVYQGLEPQVKRGTVTRIRVIREMPKTVRIDPSLRAFGFQFPVISCGATYAGKQVLGEAPVEQDGSAYFKVPPHIPIYFMALDAEGRAVQRMRSFTHFMPGEKQGCIGCHEPRRHSGTTKPGLAYRRGARDLEPPEWGADGFDYARIVQPALNQYCIECHNPDHPRGIDLTEDKTDYFNTSYDTLARENQGPKGSPYVNWIPTYNGQEQNILEITPKAWGSYPSKLAHVVLTGHPDKEGKKRFEMDAKSRRRILAWIDLNVPYYGTSETAYPELTGCRRIYPEKLDKVLDDVAKRRCASCHTGGKIPRRIWTRITNPQHNNFLRAPLAKSAGGTEKCGQAIFRSTADPDYVAILETFQPIRNMLQEIPRMDMAGGKPAPTLCRDRK
jgi:hydrazine synthase alpha subunit-like protein/F5/8 type C domain-containing protein